MAGIIKLSPRLKTVVLAIYLITFPLALFAYGLGYRDFITALSGLYFIAALAFSESPGELAAVFLLSLVGSLSEMVNVGAGNWSYAPGGGFIEKAQIQMIAFVWGCFMWTGYNLAKLFKDRTNLLWEVWSVIAVLACLSALHPKFFLDASILVVVGLTLVPWYFFYRTGTPFERAFLLFATFLGFYNEVSGILSNVWFWESVGGTNLLTLVGGSIGYSIPMWLVMKAGVLLGNAKARYE